MHNFNQFNSKFFACSLKIDLLFDLFSQHIEAILFHKWRDALEVRVFGNGTHKYSSQIPFLKE